MDSANGDDEATGLTIAQADVRLSKNGQTAAQKNDDTACAHDADGFYNCELDATDTNTVGQLTLYVHVAGALAVRHDFQVIEEAIYDALYAGSATGLLPANVTQFGGSAGTFSGGRPEVNASHWGGTAVASANVLIDGAITDAKIATDAIASTKIADGALTAAKFASGAFDAVWSVTTRTITSISGLGIALASDLSALAGKFTGITSLAEWLGLIAGKQTGNSTARTELRATGAGSGTFDETTDSQEAIRDRGDAAWITATGFSTHSAADVWAVGTRTLTSFGTLVSDVAAAVWSATTRILTAGTNIVLAKGTGITGFNDLSAAQVNAEADTALADYDAPTKAELDAAVAPLATQSSVNDLPTNAELATALAAADDAVLAAIAALNNLSSAGAQAAAEAALAAYGAALEATADAIEADTQDIQSRLPAALSSNGNMKADVREVNNITVDGAGTLNDPWGPAS